MSNRLGIASVVSFMFLNFFLEIFIIHLKENENNQAQHKKRESLQLLQECKITHSISHKHSEEKNNSK